MQQKIELLTSQLIRAQDGDAFNQVACSFIACGLNPTIDDITKALKQQTKYLLMYTQLALGCNIVISNAILHSTFSDIENKPQEIFTKYNTVIEDLILNTIHNHIC